MKFNPDCMRDLLLYLEENLTLSSDLEFQFVSIQNLEKNLPYAIQEIANMVLVLDDAGFIHATRFITDNHVDELVVFRITYSGYQLIESIRPQPVWRKVKSIGQNIGSFSISVISQIASGVLTPMVSAFLKNP